MKALVTGASGFVGTHLVKQLVKQEHAVYALIRKTSRVADLQEVGAELVYGDVRDVDSLQTVIQQHPDIDTVFHLASVLTPVSKGDEIYWESNYQGTQNLLNVGRDLSLNAFIHCSSVGVIGQLPEIPANEESQCTPDSNYGETKYKAELLALEYFQSFNIPVAVVRPAWCYGPGDRRTYKFFRMVAKGKFFIIGDGKTRLHPVYVDDVIRGLILCAEQIERAAGGVFIVAGPESVTLEYLAATTAEAANTSILPFKIPAGLAKFGATVCEALSKPLGIEPLIHHRRLDFFFRDQAFDISKIRNQLGFEPQVDVQTGVQRTVAWYQEHGWL